jgi:ribosome-binding protein aMBF1 (putative translation factor)
MQKTTKRPYKVTINGQTVYVCGCCYQAMRDAGVITMRPRKQARQGPQDHAQAPNEPGGEQAAGDSGDAASTIDWRDKLGQQ